ncbi:hypothetical protein [Clostridium oryzae]|uniref:FG-GAP repeat protein n=1 Tax=Clostridium oryzae TaxID=1450648 RepID=A0A1V4IXK6_9CLOT|nr:hypothetical protein [Clostridium oryzae]OPJ64788.1 hypothetical protein CLORY_02970 [Clostridium oryzae]
MKKSRYFAAILLISILIQLVMLIKPKQVYGFDSSLNLKLIEVMEKDTTGKGINDKIKILADEKGQGYLVDIVQKHGKSYRLKPSNKSYHYLAPYASFMRLNVVVADVNNDRIPEIITWGSLTHENDIHIFQWNGSDYKKKRN